MSRTRQPPPKADQSEIVDDPGWAKRFQRGLERVLSTPPKPYKPIGRKPKERPASKGRVHKGKTGR